MKIHWSQRARKDMLELKAYIAKDSPHYALQFTQRIIASAERLCDFPLLGHHVPEAKQNNMREIIYQGYRIIYTISHNTIHIVTVVHGARHIMGL